MAFADSNRILIGLKEETTWGVWPAGNILEARYTQETFGSQTDTTISNEVRSDRQVPDIIRTGISAQGGWSGELSYGVSAFEKWLKAVLGAASDFASPPAAITADIAFVATGNKITTDSSGTGTDFSTAAFAVGNWIRVSGATNPANNGYFQITARDTSTASAHEITVVGGTLVNETAAERTIQSSATIRNGIAKHSFSVEKQWLDLNSGSGLAARVLGMRANQFRLSLPESGILTYQLAGLGKQVSDTAGSDLTDANASLDFTTLSTVTAAATNDIMSTADGIADIILNRDAPFTTVTVQNTDIDVQTALRRQNALRTGLGAAGIGVGRLTIGGTLRAYFEDAALLAQHLKYVATDYAVVCKDGAGNAYLFDLPSVKFGGDGTPKGQGNDQDAIIDVTMQARRSTRYGLDYMVGVSKFAAAA